VITLVVGGTRSGKSEVAERIAGRLAAEVTFVAPGHESDAEMSARIAEHRARRPESWATVECGSDLVDALVDAEGVVLIDSLGSWVAAADDFKVDDDALVSALVARTEPTVLVTEEVGLSVHATTDAGRAFTDVLGRLNTKVAAIADDAFLVVAGRAVALDRLAD
jgi:adenosyl cobinamide kinase/adenosyl cobinamide phosphate guanylyltransferase